VLAAIATERPTLLTLTPPMLQILLDHPSAAATDFSSLRLTLYAGSPISLGLSAPAPVMSTPNAMSRHLRSPLASINLTCLYKYRMDAYHVKEPLSV
jgi:acyl-CoA synthetase (AMP-forming)/AMP-acid ligase II